MPLPTGTMLVKQEAASTALTALQAVIVATPSDQAAIDVARAAFAFEVATKALALLETHDYEPSTAAGRWIDVVEQVAIALLPQSGMTMTYNFSEAAWELADNDGTAVIDGANGFHSTAVALTVTGDGTGLLGGSAGIDLAGSGLCQIGRNYVLSAWIKDVDASEDTPLRVVITTGLAFVAQFSVTKGQISPGVWTKVILGVVNNAEWDPEILILAAYLQNDAVNASGSWAVDDIKFTAVQ